MIVIDSVTGACAGIGWGLASTAVVVAMTGIEVVASLTTGALTAGAEVVTEAAVGL